MRRIAGSAAVLLLAGLSCSPRQEIAHHPNAPVILISIDTLRSDRLGCYGYGAGTSPHLDGFRRDAVLFQRVYSPCPMTLPSHASIFTGLLPTEHGVRNNIGYSFPRGRLRTLAEVFRNRGYRTAAAVSSYVLRSETGIDEGFEMYDDAIPVASAGAASEHQRSGWATLKVASSWMEQNRERPFFFFFHIYEPHAPYAPPEPYKSRHRDPYDGEIAAADGITGALLEHLKRLGVYDRALIVLVSDHGEGLWEHGEDQHGVLLYRESLQVPLLIKLPRSERRGTTVSRPAQLADVFHTLLALTGAGTAERSLLGSTPSRPIYAETLYPRIHLGWSELRSMIDDRYHYIDGPKPELYDLARDAAEQSDIIRDARRIAASMKRRIDAIPSAITPTEPIDKEEAAKLAALGYVGSPQNRAGPLPNPRDEIGTLAEITAAFRLAAERRYDDAAAALRALLTRNPRLADVASKLGEVLVDLDRPEEAIDVYRAAIAHSQRAPPDLLLGAGFAFLRAGQPQQAIAHAELAMRAAPREANQLLARAYVEMQRLTEAEAAARRAMTSGDPQPSSLLILAEVQRAAGKLQEALQTVDTAEQRARALGVKHLQGAGYLRGDLLARFGRVEQAIAEYRREIENSPRHMQAYANLAVIYFIEGKPGEAERTLAALVESNPHAAARQLAAKTRRALRE